MSLDPSMRASDADRDAVASRLGAAHAEGRLDAAELQERLDSVYAARTLGELVPLTRDLPAGAPPGGSHELAAERGRPRWRTLRPAWAAWATVVGINVVIWLVVVLSKQELIYFWPIWVAGPWGVVLLVRTLAGPDQDDEGPPGRRDTDRDHA